VGWEGEERVGGGNMAEEEVERQLEKGLSRILEKTIQQKGTKGSKGGWNYREKHPSHIL